MTGAERITAAINAANERGETALVPFFTAGYPSCEQFAETLTTIAERADVVEIGVPFSDPMADGPTIQRSSHHAIANGASLRWILASLRDLGERVTAPVVLMSYLNPLLAYGLDELADAAATAGVAGFIVPDLPLEESAPVHAAFRRAGLALVQLVTPATPEQRQHDLVAASDGFVYAVTVRGITGGAAGLPAATADYLAGLMHVAGDKPVCAGFGIRAASDVAAVGQHVNGAVVGSALIEAQERGDDIAAFLAHLRAARV
ncbi:MAG: tryptophan synthase subunit alpha [Pseudomonadota bacterium]